MSEETKPFILDMITASMLDMKEDNPYAVLIGIDVLLNTIEPEWIKKHGFDTLQEDIDNFLENPTHYRLIRLNVAIKKDLETYIELLAQDRGTDPRLHYQIELENDIKKLMKQIRVFLGKIIRTRFGEGFTLD